MNKKFKKSTTREFFRANYPMLSVVLILTVLTVILYFHIVRLERQVASDEFRLQAANFVTGLNNGLEQSVQQIYSVRDLINGDGDVLSESYSQFTRGMLERSPSLLGIDWIPYVASEERLEFESARNPITDEPVEIWEVNADGERVRSPEKSEYFPLTKIEPYDEREAILGYDLGSESYPNTSIHRAIASGDMVVCPAETLDMEFAELGDIRFYLPVYKDPESSEGDSDELQGLILGCFDFHKLIDTSLKGMDLSDIHFELNNSRTGEPDEIRVISCCTGDEDGFEINGYDGITEDEIRVMSCCDNDEVGPTGVKFGASGALSYESTVNLGNDEWMVRVVPSHQYISKFSTGLSRLVLLLGLLLTLITGFLVKRTLGRTKYVEKLVTERTRELEQEMQRAVGTEKILEMQNSDLMRSVAERENAIDNAHLAQAAMLNLVDDAHEQAAELSRLNTNLAETKAKLQESSARMEAIIDSSPIGIFLIDAETSRVVRVNPHGMEMLGRHELEIVGRICHDCLPYVGQHTCSLANTSESQVITECKLHVTGGGELDVIKSANRITIDGKPHVLEIFTDITKQRQSEIRLSKINECLLSLGNDHLENINTLVALCGDLFNPTCAVYNRWEGEYVDSVGTWNPLPGFVQKKKHEGLICSELVNKNKMKAIVIRRLDVTKYARTDKKVLEHGIMTYVGQSVASGRSNVGSICMFFKKDVEPDEDEKKLLGIIASAIGGEEDRIRAEEDLQLANVELGETNKQLEVAIDYAQRLADESTAATKAKSEFLANMSHEIRTPLNAVIGMTDLVMHSSLTAEQLDFLGVAKSSADSLLRLINNILDFSKIEAGKLELEATDFNLCTVTTDIMRTFGLKAGRAGIEVTNYIERGTPLNLIGDPTRLRQVLINLVGNAEKFTEDGSFGIDIKVTGRTEDRVKLQFCVHDTGIGIPEDKINQVFEDFVQADGSTTRKYGGTGLGLSITRRIIEAMKGTIRIESEVGKGARFIIEMEFKLGKGGEECGRADLVDLNVGRVLVIDDNETVRRIIREEMEECGAQVDETDSTSVGLDLIKKAAGEENRYDGVFIDLNRPDKDLGEFLKEARKCDGFEKAPIILMTPMGKKHGVLEPEDTINTHKLLKPLRRKDVTEIMYKAKKFPERDMTETQMSEQEKLPREQIKVKILVAEDNPVNQRVIEAMLERLGHEFKIVADGHLALNALGSGEFDLVLMDVQMPGLDGLETTQALRLNPKYIDLPVIALTAHALEGDKKRCFEAGMDDYLAKPVNMEELGEVVLRWANGRRTGTGDAKLDDDKFEISGTEVVDVGKALEQLGGDEKLLGEILEIFVLDAPKRVRAMRDAISNGDSDGLKMAAHTLKGSSANVAAERIRAIALEIENRVKNDEVGNVENLLDDLIEEIDLVKVAAVKISEGN